MRHGESNAAGNARAGAAGVEELAAEALGTAGVEELAAEAVGAADAAETAAGATGSLSVGAAPDGGGTANPPGPVPADKMQRHSGGAGRSVDANAGRNAPPSRYFARLLLLVLLALCVLALRSRGGATEWMLVAVVSAVTVWCWLLPYACVGRITAERAILESTTPIDGGRLRVRLTIRLRRSMPMLWMAVRDEINNETADGERPLAYRSVGLLRLGRTQTIEYKIKGLHRGELLFPAVHVSVGDLLGMTVRSFILPCETRVLVRPSLPIGEGSSTLPAASRSGTPDAGARRTVEGASPAEDSAAGRRPGAGPDLRAYTPGDPLRRVDWRGMARGIGMQTRVGDSEPSGDALVLIDISEAAYGGDRRLFDACAGIAASAIREAFGRGNNVTLLFGGRVSKLFVRTGDKEALKRAIDALARLKVEGNKPSRDWIGEAQEQLPRGASLVCISAEPRLTDNRPQADTGDAGLIRLAKAALRRGVYPDLRIACGHTDVVQSLRRWTEGMKGTGCAVSVVPVPESYRKEPVLTEGGENDGGAAAS